jgi:hypothetical protein
MTEPFKNWQSLLLLSEQGLTNRQTDKLVTLDAAAASRSFFSTLYVLAFVLFGADCKSLSWVCVNKSLSASGLSVPGFMYMYSDVCVNAAPVRCIGVLQTLFNRL